jgi:teichuronic acid biosynthesis protein TuaE
MKHISRGDTDPRRVTYLQFLKVVWLVVLFFSILGSAVLSVPYRGFHIIPFRILLPVYLYLLLLYLFISRGQTVIRFHIKRYLAFLGFWLLWAVVSVTWSVSTVDALRHIFFLFGGVAVIFFTVLLFNLEDDIRRLFWLWILIAVVVVLIGIFEYGTGIHLSVSRANDAEFAGQQVITAIFVNPNDYAAFLALMFPFAYLLIKYSRRAFLKALGIFLASGAIFFTAVNFTRAAMVTLLLELLLMAVFLGGRRRAKFIRTVVILLIIAIPLGLAFPFLGDPIASTGRSIVDSFHTGILSLRNTADLPIRVRITLIQDVMKSMIDTRFLGVGAGNAGFYITLIPEYYAEEYANPHNWWAEILMNYGLLIFCLYLAFYLGILVNLLRVWRSSPSAIQRIFSEGLFFSLTGFLIASAGPSWLISQKYIWFLFACALCVINSHRIARKEVLF